MKHKSLRLMMLSCAALLSLGVQAGNDGGGGDVVILPNDTVVLADPFLDTSSVQPNNMPPMRAMNPRILHAVKAYLEVAKDEFRFFDGPGGYTSDIVNLLDILATRKSNIRYYAVQSVDELNIFCASGGRKTYVLPDRHTVSQVACTAGDEIFFVEPLFKRLSLRHQGLLLIHERLTTLRDAFGGKNYAAIAKVTTGLSLYLDLYQEQNYQDIYRELTPQEVNTLNEFYVGIEEIEKRNAEISNDSFQWVTHPRGGGKIHKTARIHPSVVLSLKSRVAKGSKIGEDSSLIDVASDAVLKLGKKVQLTRVAFTCVKTANIGDETVITDSSIQNFNELTIGAKQEMIKGELTEAATSMFRLRSVKLNPIVFEVAESFPGQSYHWNYKSSYRDKIYKSDAQYYIEFKGDKEWSKMMINGVLMKITLTPERENTSDKVYVVEQGQVGLAGKQAYADIYVGHQDDATGAAKKALVIRQFKKRGIKVGENMVAVRVYFPEQAP